MSIHQREPRGAAVEAARSAVRLHASALVTVPGTATQTDVFTAYDELHSLGLRASLARTLHYDSLRDDTVALSPSPGTRVRRGATISMTPTGGALGSPAVDEADPRYTVPDFAGQSLRSAFDWVSGRSVYIAVDLTPITASDAPSLLDAYRIVAQKPRPGSTLTQGVTTPAGAYEPTPLTLTVKPT